MKHFLLAATAALALSGCTTTTSNLLPQLTALANTAVGDLNSTILVANAATPPDVDGAACAKAGLMVAGQLQAELAVLPAGSTVGAFTIAEVASLYQPGSAQYNTVVKEVETGCIAKVHDLVQAGASPIGVFATLTAIATGG